MKEPVCRLALNPIAMALCIALSTNLVMAQEADNGESEDDTIEEVVVSGTRLKGTATAVLEERKNQAFVSDILGADQISRTGDSDAASALRRVTGLTLVDGKFIYVRGLGERYSSTQLNGAAVPSPDPTRNVIPLDLFPSDIIESLSVQKAYSPSMPASFGGGNVDIRLKSIPNQYIMSMSVNLGSNTDNFDDAYFYAGGGGSDRLGEDDGTRAAPAAIAQRWSNKDFLDNLSQAEALQLLGSLNRNYDPILDSVSPDVGFNFATGNNFDWTDDLTAGFLLTVGYDADTQVSDEFVGEQPQRNGDEIINVRFFDEISSTEQTVKWSTMLNFGLNYQNEHRIEFSSIVLNDTRDQITDKIGNSNNIQLIENQRIRQFDVIYEERKMFANQVRGSHAFPQFDYAAIDWNYSRARSSRNAPGNVTARFLLDDNNLDGIYDRQNESSLTNATTAGRYTFQDLYDLVENFQYKLNLPVTSENWEMEVNFGGNFVDKLRRAENRRLDINTRAFENSGDLSGYLFSDILSDDALSNSVFNSTPILRDTTIAGDDYTAAQKINAYFLEADFFYNNQWRVSGGIRWEDFRQVVVPFDPRTNQIDIADGVDRSQLAFRERDYYPAIALTYIDDDMQYRFSYGATVVRPDLREVSSATYIDPLTDFPIGGTPGIRTTAIDNFDLRWEWYRENGNNLSVALFYKDMTDPIESVQSPAQDGPPLVRIANAESGELYGVEVEFLQGLEVFGEGIWDNLFMSGNVTLSDSEITLDRQKIVEQTGVSAAITNLNRRLTGHSEYVVNLQMGYDSDDGEHSASLVYNVFGERILIPGIDSFDDSYEQPFHSLDMVYKYYPDFATTITFKIQNILGEERVLEFEDTILRSETRGRGFSITYKYEF
ncbi:MAG: TonB-dependent receptor [Gammaproteobacteria bacterium]